MTWIAGIAATALDITSAGYTATLQRPAVGAYTGPTTFTGTLTYGAGTTYTVSVVHPTSGRRVVSVVATVDAPTTVAALVLALNNEADLAPLLTATAGVGGAFTIAGDVAADSLGISAETTGGAGTLTVALTRQVGTWSEGAYTSTALPLSSIQPARGADMKRLPENRRTEFAVVIYSRTQLRTADPVLGTDADRVQVDMGDGRGTQTFEVELAEPWGQGTHWRAIAVRVGD